MSEEKRSSKELATGQTIDVVEWVCASCGSSNTSVYVDNEIIHGGSWSHFYLGKNVEGCFKGSCYIDNQIT